MTTLHDLMYGRLTMSVVIRTINSVTGDWLGECWPSAMAIKFTLAREKILFADHAQVVALLGVIGVLTGKWSVDKKVKNGC